MSDLWPLQTNLLLPMNSTVGYADASLYQLSGYSSAFNTISTVQSKWGDGSGLFNSSADNLTIDGVIPTELCDFTIEVWIYLTAYGTYAICANNDGIPSRQFQFGVNSSGYLNMTVNSTTVTDSTTQVTLNAWHHVVFQRLGGASEILMDGVLLASMANTISLISVPFYIGRNTSGHYFNGYMQDFRITRDVARYADGYTVPTAALPAPVLPTLTTGILALPINRDMEDGGSYQITGTVTELGAAGAYRVRLFDRKTARCIRETWSAADGSYVFPYIAYRANGYFAIAYDHGANPLNAAIADLITPEPMP